MNLLHRRSFLRNAALLAPGFFYNPSTLFAGSGNRLRVAFIGTGQWSRQYLATALQHPGFKIVALCAAGKAFCSECWSGG